MREQSVDWLLDPAHDATLPRDEYLFTKCKGRRVTWRLNPKLAEAHRADKACLGVLGATWGRAGGVLGRAEASRGVLRACWERAGASWGDMGRAAACLGVLERAWGVLW